MSENIPIMLTIEETAKRTGISYEYIRKLCKRGEIVFVRTGRKYLVNFDRFIEFLNTGEGVIAGKSEAHDQLN